MLDIPLISYLAILLLSTIASLDIRTSSLGYYSRFHGGLLSSVSYTLLYWAYVSNINRKETQKIINLALVAAVLVAFYAVLEHFGLSLSCLFITGKLNADCWVQDVEARVFATLGQPNWLAAYLTALLPLAMSNVLFNPDSIKLKIFNKKPVWIALSLLLFTALLFTKSRSGLLGFITADIIFWGFVFFKYKKRFLKPFLVLNTAFLILAAVFGTPWTQTLQSNEGAGPALEVGGGTDSGQIRKIVWQGAVDIWQAYPVLGTGPETFAYAYYQFRPPQHNLVSEWDFIYNKAHNEYLNLAATTGSLGLAAYLLLIVVSLIQILKAKTLNFALLAGYVSILVTNFFGFSVVMIGLLFFLFPALAVTLSVKPKTQNTKYEITGKQKIAMFFVLCTLLFTLFIIGKYWSADYLYAAGKKENRLSQPLSAAKKLEQAISLSPQEPLYHDELARSYATLAVYLWQQEEATTAAKLAQGALTETHKATTLSPRNLNLKRSQINVLSQLAAINPDFLLQTLPVFEDLKILAPTDAKVFYTLGITYAQLGQKQKALEVLEKAILLKPDYDKAKLFKQELEKSL